jgi:mRNA-degrading endonuclease toxin of MazEF toxin-antitoxin module
MTLDRSKLIVHLGTLSPAEMTAVDEGILAAVDLDG